MSTLFLLTLFIFGTMFGSFASVLIYRLRSGEGGILGGRSHCQTCNKNLQAIDLIPLFSWLCSLGKCRRCKTKVSAIYPFLELSTGIVFVGVGAFLANPALVMDGNIYAIFQLLFWLTISFISIIYIFYDILFLEIHEGVLATGVGIGALGVITQALSGSIGSVTLISNLPTASKFTLEAANNYSITIFLIIIISLYIIILKGLKEWQDFSILGILWGLVFLFSYYFTSPTEYTAISASIGALAIFTFFFLQIVLSGGRWMGQGDLRIAVMVGILLGTTLSFPAMMLCYFSGSIIGIGVILYQKRILKKEKADTQIPFGPFIAIGFFLAVFFQEHINVFLDNFLYI